MYIRTIEARDEDAVIAAYRCAFNWFPWFQTLSEDDARRDWEKSKARRGFGCLVCECEGLVDAASWYDLPTREELMTERGEELAAFADERYPGRDVVWIRETVCVPAFQGKGIAGTLKRESLKHLHERFPGTLLLTRMRDDNVGIVRINERLGFLKTGVRVASRAYPGLMHDYWFLPL